MALIYKDFWLKNGLDYIAPKDLENPEGFDYLQVIKDLSVGNILDFGCGKGKIVPAFTPKEYLGVDFNPNVIDVVKEKYPDHEFRITDMDESFVADTAVFYSVCVHMPDNAVKSQIERVKCSRVIIAEIMNTKYRRNEDAYTIANNRSVEQYDEIVGRKRIETINKTYEYYGCDITYAVFT